MLTQLVIYIINLSFQVTTYVVTRPGRELLFTVVSQDEKYKAKVPVPNFFFQLGQLPFQMLLK